MQPPCQLVRRIASINFFFWVEFSLVSCLIVFERSSNLYFLNTQMARDISLCFFYHWKSLPIANATSNCRIFSKCVTKAQLGHLRYGVSTLVLSLQLRRLCGRVYQCPDWCCFKKHHQLEAMILELFGWVLCFTGLIRNGWAKNSTVIVFTINYPSDRRFSNFHNRSWVRTQD